MTDTPAKDQDKYVLRLPDGMRDRIKAAADKRKRSMNQEIIATLEREYPPPQPFDLDDFLNGLVEAAKVAGGDVKILGQLVFRSNEELKRHNSEWRVAREFDPFTEKAHIKIVPRDMLPKLDKNED